MMILRQAMQRLGREAAARPGVYLEGYQAMRRILGAAANTVKRAEAGDLLSAQKAIRQLLPEAEATPAVGRAAADGGLSGLYFSRLKDPLGKP
jgi:hypothetical protein